MTRVDPGRAELCRAAHEGISGSVCDWYDAEELFRLLGGIIATRLRADAQRNRERIVGAARELFASGGTETQMDDIAERAGLGVGSLYRHFPNKEALLTEVVRERFEEMTDRAREAELIDDGKEAFKSILYTYLVAVEGDLAFQRAMLRFNELNWDGIHDQKAEFAEVVTRIIARAVAQGSVRADLTYTDFPIIATGAISNMYFKPNGRPDWRRHVALLLQGVESDPHAPGGQ